MVQGMSEQDKEDLLSSKRKRSRQTNDVNNTAPAAEGTEINQDPDVTVSSTPKPPKTPKTPKLKVKKEKAVSSKKLKKDKSPLKTSSDNSLLQFLKVFPFLDFENNR